MAKQPISIRVNSKHIISEIIRLQESGAKGNIMQTVALSLMPQGVNWFEYGEDWNLTLWITDLAQYAMIKRKHFSGTYTFQTGKAKF